MDRLPIFVDLAEKRCLVVGGGIVAERKLRLLIRTGASIAVLAPALTDVKLVPLQSTPWLSVHTPIAMNCLSP